MKYSMKSLASLFLISGLIFAFTSLSAKESQDPGKSAVQAMIAEHGLQESNIAARDLPGWKKPQKVVVRLIEPDHLVAR